MLVGEVQSENPSEGFSHIHRILYTQVVEDAAQIIDKDVQGRLELVFSMTDPPMPRISERRTRSSPDSKGTQFHHDLPLRENPCCNSKVGTDCHESVKSSS